jgi:MscS family membrane protein
VVGISVAAGIAAQKNDASGLFSAIGPLREVAVIACIAWFMVRVIANFQDSVHIGEEGMDHTTVDALSKLARASVVITAALVVLQTLGFSISGVLAFGGVGGIAIGFAAKDLLANFFGGLMIYMDRPFSVGDWIRSPDREIEGTVEKIGWRLTCIRSFQKRPIYVPNSVFATIVVENPSRMSHRRINETIGVRYVDEGKFPEILKDVEKMLRNHEEIDDSQTLMVNFNKFSESSLDFFIYTFTHTTNWVRYHQIKQDVLFRIASIIGSHGAEVAFPTSTIHVPEGIQVGPEVTT